MSTDLEIQDGRLTPDSGHGITQQLHLLFASMPMQGGADPKAALTGYLIALQGRPLWAVENAVRKFLRGEVKGASTKFCPRPPEIAAAVSDEMAHVYEELDRKKQEQIAEQKRREQIAERTREFPPEHRIRMLFKLSVWSASLTNSARLDELAASNLRDMNQMIAFAKRWGVPVPDEILSQVKTAA